MRSCSLTGHAETENMKIKSIRVLLCHWTLGLRSGKGFSIWYASQYDADIMKINFAFYCCSTAPSHEICWFVSLFRNSIGLLQLKGRQRQLLLNSCNCGHKWQLQWNVRCEKIIFSVRHFDVRDQAARIKLSNATFVCHELNFSFVEEENFFTWPSLNG